MKAFSNFYPAVLMIYFLSVFSVSMFIQNPVYLILSIIGAVLFLCTLQGVLKTLKSFIKFIPFLVLITFINPLFSHNGATPLFFINDNPFTLEALIYGCILALMIICVILWFKSFNLIFDSEKLLFLFGKISPKISLVFSMALHFIPNFFRYFKEVLSVFKTSKQKSKIRLYIACFSSVITHSLESSVDTADSMSARGYSSGKPTVFSRFRFKKDDLFLLVLTVILIILTYIPIALKSTIVFFYPKVIFSPLSVFGMLSYWAFGLLCILPAIYEIKEDIKWKYSISKI
ncbi:MAG: energy-coupling factor transporter transmembrane component T [Oscillospiraceae bacterium]|nr:energy-coupling factor transporter transmembrane component T [Oscillospiraceae bacterium]